jgi:outer membrane protein OmpA-like peptidoglycan-associated protein
MRPSFTFSFLAAFAFALACGAADAQSWLDVLKDRAAQEAVEHGSEALQETADGKVKCVAGDQACIDQAQQQGQEVVLTNKKGKVLPPERQPGADGTASTTSAGTTTGSSGAKSKEVTATAGGAGVSAGQPSMTAVKCDFVPGDKLIFYDDFTDMAGDESPPHWKVRGGTAELQAGNGVRQLVMATHGMYMSPNIKQLPKNFTMEVDTQFGTLTGNGNGMIWRFSAVPDGPQTLRINTRVQEGGTRVQVAAGNPDDPESVADTVVQVNPREPIQFALWVQEGRIRLYLNGKRAMDVNQITLEPIKVIDMEAAVEPETPGAFAAVRRVRFAETAPDFSKTIMSGRYVTHGILFDTDSDRIKPDSAATIRMIASGLQSSANGNFLIEGHTDSTGDAAHNMDLSKRRAEAVKSVLVAQFGIDGARLSTAGLGATKPVASNDTPAGRAENRRVEFVRQ